MGNFQKSKFIIKLFCLCFTFALGTTTVKYQYDLFLPSVSVREVAQKRSFYDGRKVRLRAKVVSSSGIIVLSDDIDKDSSFASLTLPENYSPTSGSVQEILNEADPNLKSASVLITGKIDSHSKFQCHAPTFVIDAINIEVVSEVNVEPNNGDVKN